MSEATAIKKVIRELVWLESLGVVTATEYLSRKQALLEDLKATGAAVEVCPSCGLLFHEPGYATCSDCMMKREAAL